jgi:ammonia channel protein AmtB
MAFNAGSELKVDDITATAFLNTDIAASFAAVTWLFVEWWYAKKPHFVGLLTGAVAGLARLGVFAGTAINPSGAQGLVHGRPRFSGSKSPPASAARPTRSGLPT